MKVSALQEYALRCLLQLAKNQEVRPMSAEEISTNEHLSPAYIEKILQKLTKAGFVKSIRGTKGGYILTRIPEEISVGQVIRSVDGSSMTDLCTHFSGNSPECTHIGGCGIRPLWTNIYKYIYDVLDRTSLNDLMKEEASTALAIEAKFIRSFEEMAAK
jgi:Rrf2 family protein